MLDKFRKIIQGWLGKALITLLLLPFALFGVSSIFQVNPNKNIVVEVNGVEIEERELLRAVEISKQNLISRLGEQASSFVTNEMVQPAAMESLISQELIRQSAKENKLDVSMDAIHKMITDMEVFQLNGLFSQSHFEELLRRNGLRPETFPEKIRDEFLQRQLNSGYQSTGFSMPSEIHALKALRDQARSFSYIELQPERIISQIEVTDAQVQSFYDKNRETFRTEEQVSIEYVEVNRSQFIGDLSVTEGEVEKRYAEKLLEIEENQERSASHILIEISGSRDKVEAKRLADDLYSKIVNGEGFSLIAKEFSDDKGSATQGGSLGFAGRDVYVDEFEESLFSLKMGEVSKPILTEFGYHIIKLEAVQPEAGSLASMESEIIEELKISKAEQPYQDAIEELKNLVYESSDLAEPASYLGSKVQVSARFSKSLPVNELLVSAPAIVNAAFSTEVLNDGNNSDVIELNDGKAVVLRLKEHFPSKIKSVEEVKSQIKATLTQEQAKEKIKTLASEMLVLLKAGTSKDEISKQYELEWKEADHIKRDNGSVSRDILDEIFKQPKPASSEPYTSSFSLPSGSHVVSILFLVNSDENKVGSDLSETASSEVDDEQMRSLLEGQKGSLEFRSFQAWLKGEAKIKEL
ncbi:MAG: SurA N-terminal domain-containing protein [Pseudomonadales bacterium]|nr:SurA N-terminal domain-containing protein [Pseudomonadales bacterium]